MFGLPEIAGGLIGSVAGNLLAGGSRKPTLYYTPQFINKMNELLDKSLSNALSTSTDYTNKAVNTLQQSKQDTSKVLQQYLKNALDQSQQLGQSGLNAYQTLQRPYAQAGYDALDAYRQTLGLSTPVEGSAQQVKNLQIAQELAPLLSGLKGQHTAPIAPIIPNYLDVPDDKVLNRIIQSINPAQVSADISRQNPNVKGRRLQQLLQDPGTRTNVVNALAAPIFQKELENVQNHNKSLESQYLAAKQLYDQQTSNYTNIMNILNTIKPDQLSNVAYTLRGLLKA